MLTSQTKTTIGTVASILTVGICATWALSNVIVSQFTSLRADVTALQAALDSVKGDRLTLTAASEAALRTAIENPGFRVVDPRDPTKVIVVVARNGTP